MLRAPFLLKSFVEGAISTKELCEGFLFYRRNVESVILHTVELQLYSYEEDS